MSIFAAIKCDSLPEIVNGANITYNGDDDGSAPYDHGAIATYSCVTGFYLTGDTKRTCGDGTGTTGSWDGAEPTCNREFLAWKLV